MHEIEMDHPSYELIPHATSRTKFFITELICCASAHKVSMYCCTRALASSLAATARLKASAETT